MHYPLGSRVASERNISGYDFPLKTIGAALSAKQDDPAYIASVKERTEELEKVLSEFSDRLRRMRGRNRQTQREIESFQSELDALHDWLVERL